MAAQAPRPIEEFQGVVVNKPWGYEYLMYQNGTIAIWCLHIRHGSRTSMHCHPRKKTGLILVSGEAEVSFLNDSVTMKALSKLTIRPGLFHSTAALSPEGIIVLEVENPCDKANLVRLEDGYGRRDQPYEGVEAISHDVSNCVLLNQPRAGQELTFQLQDCVLSMERAEDSAGLKNRPPGEIIVILEGGLVSREGESVLGAGDVVSPSTLDRLTEIFSSAPSRTSLLTIRKRQDGLVASPTKKPSPVTAVRSAAEPGKRSPELGLIPGLADDFPRSRTLEIFRKTCVNRYFELQVAKVFQTGIIKMPVYLSLGEEHIPAAIASVTTGLMIFAQHRAHSYYLSFGGDMERLIDELLHRATGCAGGMGGSASIHDPKIGMFGHSGLMGDQVPIAVGTALGSGRRVLAVMGDASAEEDYVISAIGYAVTKKCPVLFVCEDNNLSILTHVSTRRSWSVGSVAQALGMKAADIADDPWLVAHTVESLLPALPAFINIRTCRQLWHAGVGSDGPMEWNRFEMFQEELRKLGLADEARDIEAEARSLVEKVWQERLQKP